MRIQISEVDNAHHGGIHTLRHKRLQALVGSLLVFY
ncbi:hypothetical protein ABIB00_007724 [Bradyrhizobium sp. LB14.3]